MVIVLIYKIKPLGDCPAVLQLRCFVLWLGNAQASLSAALALEQFKAFCESEALTEFHLSKRAERSPVSNKALGINRGRLRE